MVKCGGWPLIGLSWALLCACAADQAGQRGTGRDRATDPFGNAPGTAGAAAPQAGAGDGFQNATGQTPPRPTGAEPPAAGSPNECGGKTYRGEVKNRLDLFVTFDLSGSMFLGGAGGYAGGCFSGFEAACQMGGATAAPGPGANTYATTSAALRDFVTAPASSGIGVALRGYNDECDVDAMSVPDVPMAPLPNNTDAIVAWIDRNGMGAQYAGTETVPALRGAVQFMRGWLQDNAESTGAILLVTDGEPDAECAGDDVAAVAADALAGTPSLPVYVLGLGNIAGLHDVAAAGGTGQAFVVDDPAASGASIAEALDAIRGDAQPLPCAFRIPDGGERTPDLVNLDYTPAGASSANTIPRVSSAADCDPAQGGWHYDDPGAPAAIIACSATCSELSGGGGSVDVALGCPTVVLE